MAKLPKDVEAVKRGLSRVPSHDLSEIAEKLLIADSPKIAKMWRTLEGRKVGSDDLWVWGFLRAAADAANLPPYHYMSKKDRGELADRIGDLATKLSRALDVNGLDADLIYRKEKMFNGFFLFEDFSESTRECLDADDIKKLKVSALIKGVAERSQKKIADEPIRGKGGANAPAIRFVRLIAARNRRHFGKVLNAVTATAANAIFATHYTEGDITNLLAR